MRRILFAAGDVGGARALLPVMAACENRGLSPVVLAHGHVLLELPPHRATVPPPVGPEAAAALFSGGGICALIFASSMHDTVPLALARQARASGIPVVHVLDNWSNYRRRLEHDGLPMLVPDLYTVMDEVAREGAMDDGIPAEILRITGQPALASLAGVVATLSAGRRERGPLRLLFVSEPAEADQGAGPESPWFRGYTEKTVLRDLCCALQSHADRVVLTLLPHPREDRQALERCWREVRGRLSGEIIQGECGRRRVLAAEGVIGMASILLYEAWLAGKPVFSLQPDVRRESLKVLSRRADICFVDAGEEIADALESWLPLLRRRNNLPQPDLARHQGAAGEICTLLEGLSAGQCRRQAR